MYCICSILYRNFILCDVDILSTFLNAVYLYSRGQATSRSGIKTENGFERLSIADLHKRHIGRLATHFEVDEFQAEIVQYGNLHKSRTL